MYDHSSSYFSFRKLLRAHWSQGVQHRLQGCQHARQIAKVETEGIFNSNKKQFLMQSRRTTSLAFKRKLSVSLFHLPETISGAVRDAFKNVLADFFR